MNAETAYASLAAVLDGQPPPCAADPEVWYAPSVKDAVQTCWDDCPGMAECGRLADVLGEQHGVWGGQERTRKKRGPAWVAPDLTDQEWAS